jgi:hypothetical protein
MAPDDDDETPETQVWPVGDRVMRVDLRELADDDLMMGERQRPVPF